MRGKVCDKETLQKAYRYLMGKGYDYETAKSALATMGETDEE
jgi:SOS response regulatory protein OraA/RecX